MIIALWIEGIYVLGPPSTFSSASDEGDSTYLKGNFALFCEENARNIFRVKRSVDRMCREIDLG